jgi:ribosomal protein L21
MVIDLSGGIGRAFKKVVAAPFKAVGKVLGMGGGQKVTVKAPDVSGAQIVPSVASPAPEAPVLGTENTAQDTVKKKKGKSRLLINRDGNSSSSSGYSGLNI